MSAVHVSLNVRDLEASTSFYRGLFGEPRKRRADYVKFVGRDPEIHLSLQPGLASEAPGSSLSHLGIRVDTVDAVRAWRADLKARGLMSDEERREACCYALQEKFWITDPDGNRWEIYAVLEDLEDEPREAQTCCAS